MKIIAVLVVLALAGCSSSGGSGGSQGPSTGGGSSSGVATFDVHGEYGIAGVVGGGLFTSSGTSCAGDGAAASIVDGAPVKVESVNGKTLATGSLSGGTTSAGNQVGDIASCVFTLDVAGVPEGETFYRLVVGSRPPEQLPASKLHGKLSLTFLG